VYVLCQSVGCTLYTHQASRMVHFNLNLTDCLTIFYYVNLHTKRSMWDMGSIAPQTGLCLLWGENPFGGMAGVKYATSFQPC
jgi:hypothetical protein